MYKRKKEQVHFIGIGGIGMSGIAEILCRQGFPVSGSDLAESDTVKKLKELGIRVAIGHRPENIAGAKVVVYSSAVTKENPEILEAQKLAIPIVPRAEMLAELMRLKFGIAVAGTHGKTTTTSMLATILNHADVDPTVIVGGKVDTLGGNAKVGTGNFLVAEADESDGSFLQLSPVLTIVTNIDNDHLDYYGRMEKLRMSFLEFVNKVPYYGRSIFCADDAEILKILPLVEKPFWTYGFSENANFKIVNFKENGLGSVFEVHQDGQYVCEVKLHVPGRHNACNAVAALAAAIDLDINHQVAADGLAKFSGVRRRFEKKGEWNGITIIDDYGHHPTEMLATLEAAKQFWKTGRVIVAFQPHRFTRTQVCWDQFGPSLKSADAVFLLDIYSAGEAQINGIESAKLCEQMKSAIKEVHYSGSLESTQAVLKKFLKKGDLLITLGAGNITQLGPILLLGK